MYYFIRVMLPITFDYFLMTFQNFLQMFSAVNNFKMLKIGSANDRCANSNKRTNQKHQNNIKLYKTTLTGNGKRRHCAHQNHVKQQNEYYSKYSLNFLQNIFRCDPLCNH